MTDVQFASQLFYDDRLMVTTRDEQLGSLNSFVDMTTQIPVRSRCTLKDGENVQAHGGKHGLNPSRMSLRKSMAALKTLK
jgi:hypothetical protein